MARWPGMSAIRADRVPMGPLRGGNIIKMPDATIYLVQYVNSSGAYVIPLASNVRHINGQAIDFYAGGRTISANSVVEVIDPREMDISSPEYRRYVRMLEKLGTSGISAAGAKDMRKKGKGAPIGEFDNSEYQLEEPADAATGGTVAAGSSTPNSDSEGDSMAKKSKANGASKRERATKTVRKCACGCGGETTGYFVPGHDSKLHGWVKRLADGRIDGNGKDAKSGEKIVPGAVLKALDLKATKEGHRAMSPHFYKEV